jgi:hypothetical protein
VIRDHLRERKISGFKKMKKEEQSREIFGVQEKAKNNNPQRMWCSGHGYPCVTIYFGTQVDVFVSVLRPTFSVPDKFFFRGYFFADSDRHG